MNVLAIGIHMDDCEYGMGGTAQLLSQKGAEVTMLNIKPYMHDKGGNPEADAQSMRAAEKLGARKIILEYRDTKYYRNNEKTVRLTEEVIRDTRPDILFIMHPQDHHIEHAECARTAREAVFAAAVDGVGPNEIYTYECGPNQTMHFFVPDLMINIEKSESALKDSLMGFSQDHAAGEWLWKEKSICAKFRGHASGFPLAEGFKILKYPEGNHNFLLLDTLREAFRWCGNRMYFPQSGEWF